MRGGDRTVAHPATADGLTGARSFDVLATVRRWTADLALKLLPETNQPRVEVLAGSVIVSPHATFNHQVVQLELAVRLRSAAKAVGLTAIHEINVTSGEDLFIPDLAVVRGRQHGRVAVDIADAVLLGEITSRGNRRKDVIDRRREYADAGVPWFLLVDLQADAATLILNRLVEGAYQEVARAIPGELFRMSEPFAFEVDPAELLES